jgi:two-component system response regulator QseB
MRILLIEDDELIGQGLEKLMQSRGYQVVWRQSAEKAINDVHGLEIDVVILDLNLPGMDGIQWLKQIRSEEYTLPVLILTARDALHDRVKGLDAGADDYLLKPFAFDELEARVRALYRRTVGRSDETLVHNGLSINLKTREVEFDHQRIDLSRREYSLLLYFTERSGRVITRRQLEEALYEKDDNPESNALEVHVHSLRKKLGKAFIRTIRGVGYQWVNKE